MSKPEELILLESDYNKKKFKIEIIVAENCSSIAVMPIMDGYVATYQEIIGALEINKHHMITQQSEVNRKNNKKKTEKKV